MPPHFSSASAMRTMYFTLGTSWLDGTAGRPLIVTTNGPGENRRPAAPTRLVHNAPMAHARPHPSTLSVAIALGIVYVVWGSTYLAIAYVVETLPPFLAAGARFLVAGGGEEAAPALPEYRRLTLEYPPVIKLGSGSDVIILTLDVDAQGNITPTAQ